MEYSRSFDADPSAVGGPDPHPRRQEFSRLTGHLTVSEASHSQPIERQPQTPAVRAPESVIAAALGGTQSQETGTQTQRSEWHSYQVDAQTGKVVDQRTSMGQAFLRELQPEQMMSSPAQDDDSGDQQQIIDTQQVAQSAPVRTSAASPRTNVVLSPAPDQSAYPIGTPQTNASTATPPITPVASIVTSPTPVIVPSIPATQNRRPQFSQPYATSTAASSPVEPMLPPGPAMHVDDQHLLPAPQSSLAKIVKSPWLWLVVGIGMIVYFTR